MKLTTVVILALGLNASPAMAQNSGAAGSAGDAAVSPATGSSSTNGPASDSGRQRTSTGVSSGVLDNGTTGDTIGPGPGTTSSPTPRTATPSSPPRN
jgi:hypothetical protein